MNKFWTIAILAGAAVNVAACDSAKQTQVDNNNLVECQGRECYYDDGTPK